MSTPPSQHDRFHDKKDGYDDKVAREQRKHAFPERELYQRRQLERCTIRQHRDHDVQDSVGENGQKCRWKQLSPTSHHVGNDRGNEQSLHGVDVIKPNLEIAPDRLKDVLHLFHQIPL